MILYRLTVIFDFKQTDEGKLVISRQEDILDPEELIKVFNPYFAPVVKVFKRVITSIGMLNGRICELTGWS